MRDEFSAAMAASTLALCLIAAGSGAARAQSPDAATGEYARAIHSAIQKHWQPRSLADGLAPGSRCSVRIAQLPGGRVHAVDVLPGCAFDSAGQAAVVEAVRRSEPLPYRGFESVFRREITFVFHAASAQERQAFAAERVQAQRTEKAQAESDRSWQAGVGMQKQRDEYVQRCSFHLRWETTTVVVPRRVVATIVLDAAGKVQQLTDARGKPLDPALAQALSSTTPCEPVPAELLDAGVFRFDMALIPPGRRR